MADGNVSLVHRAAPGPEQIAAGAYQLGASEGGLWVYRNLPARTLWDQIMRSTYDHAEPGVLFLDRINRDNNLSYCETIATTNPALSNRCRPTAAAVWVRSIWRASSAIRLPQRRSSTAAALRNWFVSPCACSTTCSDVTVWPLPQQHVEAMNKRRIGLASLRSVTR